MHCQVWESNITYDPGIKCRVTVSLCGINPI